ncbi:MAG: alpha/beta fold hydrolase [Phycisphaeraceae bacterium]|nr:alpha/beta fold hydrolase [Phycisphaeraceae bacterium]
MSDERWLLLPGMGADARMYDALVAQLDWPVMCVNWSAWSGERTILQVARRIMAEQGVTENDVLVGSSLGGMIALEIAQQVRPRAVVLLGSALKANEVSLVLRVLARFSSMVPWGLARNIAAGGDALLLRMFHDADPRFIRVMSAYLPHWPGYQGKDQLIVRFHGRRDRLIKCPKCDCHVFEDAGHMLAMSHPAPIAIALKRLRDQLSASSR